MAITGGYLFMARMDVDPAHEAEFNDVYDTEHVPLLSTVPGVLSIARFKRRELTMMLGGKLQRIELADEPAYTAIYELASPEVLVSEAWSEAVEQGRWPERVRPHTTNRRHVLLERAT